MKLEFAVTLFGLTAFYGLILALFGAGVLSETRQRQLSYGTVGLGFLLVYPLVTVLVVWIAPSWVFGIVCACIFLLWLRLIRRDRSRVVSRLALCARHAVTLAAIAVLFWMPGMLGKDTGLFTEAGGDFTIYAGLPAKLGDKPLWTISPRAIGPFRLQPALIRVGGGEQLSPNADPPSPGWSLDRIVELRWGARNPGWYSLQHVLFQASWGPLELRYLAVLAVLWSVLVLSLQRLVRLRYGRLAGLIALLILVASHGLVAIGYNHYLPELLASTLLAATVLLLALPGSAALPLSVRFAVTAVCIAFVGIAYYPLLPATLIPVVLLAGSCSSLTRRALRFDWPHVGLFRTILVVLGGAYLVTTTVGLYIAEAADISTMMTRFLVGNTGINLARDLLYLGKPRSYNLAWFDTLFGGFSLQMLPPYATSDPSKNPVAWFLAAGGVLLVLGFVYVGFQSWRRNERAVRSVGATAPPPEATGLEEGGLRRIFPMVLIVILCAELLLGKSFEYTQFKGLAYVLPFILLGFALTASWLLKDSRWPIRLLVSIATVLLVGSLAVFRVEGVMRIANGRDRAAVLGLGVPALADNVHAEDPQAFVLAFPSHPSEYSLWEFGLRNARGLIMRYYSYPASKESYLTPAALRHLWILQDAPDREEHAGRISRGSASAYPVSFAKCSVRAAVLHADGRQVVSFSPLGTTTPLWLDGDVEYWIFGARAASEIEVLVKEHQALHDGSVEAQLVYPVTRNISIPVARVKKPDALATLPTTELPASDLVVLRIPGTGYSDVRCD